MGLGGDINRVFYGLSSIPLKSNPLQNARVGEWVEYRVRVKGPSFIKTDGKTRWEVTKRGGKMATIERTGFLSDRIVLPLKDGGMRPSGLSTTQETLLINGEEYETTRIQYQVSKTVSHGPTLETDILLWFSNEVPVLGLLKEVRRTVISKPDGRNFTVTDTLEYIRGGSQDTSN